RLGLRAKKRPAQTGLLLFRQRPEERRTRRRAAADADGAAKASALKRSGTRASPLPALRGEGGELRSSEPGEGRTSEQCPSPVSDLRSSTPPYHVRGRPSPRSAGRGKRHGLHARARAAWSGAAARAASTTRSSARSASSTPKPDTAEITNGAGCFPACVPRIARLRRATCS